MEREKLWENVLSKIEPEVSKASFQMWFKNSSIGRLEDGVVEVTVPNLFARDWLSDKYHKLILHYLRMFAENIRVVEYSIARTNDKKAESKNSSTQTPNFELPLNDNYINREDNLNPRYTFESFVVGPFNEVAHAAARAIIDRPGFVYNPFFIYGGTGHGKTHLIQAIGNHIKKIHPMKKVFYLTTEKFVLEYTTSVQVNKINQFKEKYRKYDMLIMDDIQFLSTKERTQEELFHLFNTLYDENKHIVFSSDKHPNYIPNLEERLRSRFQQGMIVDIPAPDQESRHAIIKAKIGSHSFSLADDVVDFLSTFIEGNIRELEGILNSIMFQSKLKKRDLSLNDVKQIIKTNERPKKNISPKEIAKIVADFYNIEEENIFEKTRRKEVVRPRQVLMYILREDYSFSYPAIGQKLGGRDHTTVIHSCEKIKAELKTDPTLETEIGKIRTLIC